MRIISGSARGTQIEAPEGMDTRPVTDKIRQALFNIWQFDIPGARFLDLFSGSGSMGLEAISRGASRAVLVEKSLKAAAVIRKNRKTCHMEQKPMEIRQQDVFDTISALQKENAKFDIIYLDPPYTVDEIFHPVMEALGNSDLCDKDGQVVIRTLREKKMNDRYGNLEKYREKSWGISTAHFYRPVSDSDKQA